MKTSNRSLPLSIASLHRAYREGTTTPTEVIEELSETIAGQSSPGIWIHLRDKTSLLAEARSIERAFGEHGAGVRGPLYGIPFAVKDNIDVGGVPTTAACPGYAYVPSESAPVVARLCEAGAIFVGKTNLDQLATGLVGVRSPYGIPPNPFDARYISGGSSSGSAAAVTRGLVSFALATDTAGSGRVPAAFNHIVGHKPSRGLFSTRGVVPACKSMDCVSLMTLTCDDARTIARVVGGFDAQDPYSRRGADGFRWEPRPLGRRLRLGVPRLVDRAFDDPESREQFDRAVARLRTMGDVQDVDMSLFFEAGRLLYDGPFIAERLSAFETFARERPEQLLPVIRTILAEGEPYRATDAFLGLQRLVALRRAVEAVWNDIDTLVVPSVPGFPRIEEVAANPIAANARLGLYTTFGNLLDLAAVAAPAGFRASDGLPSSVTFLGPWGSDAGLLDWAAAFHRQTGGTLGATGFPFTDDATPAAPDRSIPDSMVPIAVVGAHLSGQPLNHELTDRGARLLRAARTSPSYRLYALATQPAKPGLVRVTDGSGIRIEVEVWELPAQSVGSFLLGVRTPLAIGMIALDDGASVHGFLCEGLAAETARDISSFGGWRAYLAAAH